MPLLDDPWLPAPDGTGNIPNVRAAAPVGVYRFDGVSSLAPLANVECLSIETREGIDPGHARFRYNLASGISGAPYSIETALSSAYSGAAIVDPGDRLVVIGQRPDGTTECLFDGLATNFEASVDPRGEDVFLDALGIAWTCFDYPIAGALQRNASTPTTVADVQTGLVAHFNPDGIPNATPVGSEAGTMSGGNDYRYPTFLDPKVIRKPDVRTQWYLAMAARYILFTANASQQYVSNPDGAALDSLLGTITAGGGTVGGPPSGPIVCPDTPITGKDWPGTLYRLVTEVGFGMNWALSTTGGGTPQTALNLFGRQAGAVKSIYLNTRGTPFSPTTFNVGSAAIGRDTSEVVNQWIVRGGVDQWEASFILAPGFPCNPVDAATPAALAAFDKNSASYATNNNAYRLYVFDETGEGHYAAGSTMRITTVPSLDALFGAPVMGSPTYCQRRRKPIGDLITLDDSGKPYPARLAISTNYAGASPGLWDGTGSWQTVTSTTWKLLADRLGISITDSNPNSWDIGRSQVGGASYPTGVVKGIEDQVLAGSTRFTLRLTCVVKADRGITAVAVPMGGSPIARTIARFIDASDRYLKATVDYPSEFNQPGGAAANVVVRDDTPLAVAEAVSMRGATEAGVLDGPVTIPRLTTYYRIGDRIGQIEGRNLGLRTDSGTGSSTPIYPVVTGVRWDFGEDGQRTTITLSDAGSDRKRYARKRRRVLRDSQGRPRWNRHGG